MINSIELQGFKSFVHANIDLGNLTLLTGLNSSGKSSIMQAILLLEKASKNEAEMFLAGHGSLSEFRNVYSEEGISILGIFDDEKEVLIHWLEKEQKIFPKWESGFPEIIYISADRFGPEISVPVNPNHSKLGKKGENIFKCIENYADERLNDLLRHEKSEGVTFLFNLRAWLSVISPNVKFNSFIQHMTDSSYGTFNGHRAKNVGFGLSYALPVITALLLGTIIPNSIVMIENPEAHLHPKGQTEMARLISLCVEAGAQIIIETHSDHLFDGVRIFTKESNSNFHNKVKIYWFELDSNNNTITELVELDNDGRIENWHAGLFDQFEINSSKLL